MKTKPIVYLAKALYLAGASLLSAQELGRHFKKVSEGICAYAAVLNEANSTIIFDR